MQHVLIRLLEADKGSLGGVASDGGEAGDTGCPFGDAGADPLELVDLVADVTAEISRAGYDFEPVLGEAIPCSLDQRGFHNQN